MRYFLITLFAAVTLQAEVTRVYEYLMAGIALLAAAVGVTLVIVALVESLIPVAGIELGTSVVNSLLSGVTLLLVGGPLWWVFWSRINRVASDSTLGTRMNSALQGNLDVRVVRDLRIPVAILLAAGAISGYHWSVYRDDRSRLPAPQARLGARYVLLVGAPEPALVGAVEHRTGARVDLWVRADGLAGPWMVDDVVAAVQASPTPALTIIASPAGLETVGMLRP